MWGQREGEGFVFGFHVLCCVKRSQAERREQEVCCESLKELLWIMGEGDAIREWDRGVENFKILGVSISLQLSCPGFTDIAKL